MKLEVWTGIVERDDVVRLALLQDGDIVRVHCVDADGKHICGSNLIKFMSDGTVWRTSNVSTTLGFELDDEGKLKIR